MIEKNEKGAFLVDPFNIAKAATGDGCGACGWVKQVNKIDKTKSNGYSLEGPFLKQGLQWLQPGSYILCRASRKLKHYYVFILRADGTAEKIGEENDVRDWAPRLWPSITEGIELVKKSELVDVPATDGAVKTKLAELMERKKALEQDLDLVNDQIQVLTEIKKEGVV
jgi:hypothetical protein